VAEHGVLELELGHAPPAGEHSDPANEHEVDEESQGPRMLPASAVTAEPSFGPPRTLLLLAPSGMPWIEYPGQHDQEIHCGKETYDKPDQSPGLQQQPSPESKPPSNSTLGVPILENKVRNRDIARTIAMTATTSPIAAPISAEAAISPIVSSASSATNHTKTAVAPAIAIAIASAAARLIFFPEPGRGSMSPFLHARDALWDLMQAPFHSIQP
jgi:hypothetical protein